MTQPSTSGWNDASKLGIGAAIASLGYVFWVVGGMELVERLAFYGVKTTASIYATDAQSMGGLGLTMTDFSWILLAWALFQSFVPVFFGATADRIGYKETIALSTVIKIGAYLIMALFPSFWGFLLGAATLAFGTGIFKPGIQGTLVKCSTRENSAMAWGLFYQMVNIGGWLGPILAAQMRILAWDKLFFACAAIISLNFLLLLTYREPGKAQRRAVSHQSGMWRSAWREIRQPHLMRYTLLFSGFWFMFMALFDVLPVYIRDWVDTRTLVTGLFGDREPGAVMQAVLAIDPATLAVLPEGIMNINFGMIMLVCFLYAAVAGRIGTVPSLVIGTLLCSLGLLTLGLSTYAWIIVLAVLVFSSGEMLASPTSSKFIGNLAPDDKKAMYLGFKELPYGIGWVAESIIGPRVYDAWGAKETLAREALAQHGMTTAQLGAIPQGEYFQHLQQQTGLSAGVLTEQLYHSGQVGMVWYLMAAVGLATTAGLIHYGRWLQRHPLS
ncbi:Major Facilitator Superfamily protein [Ferrimonas sediminum]|uniref:Major Facilitator Superfamily protein n=1 Tax=Ferrimonas sediminum TaxID=718193 RepID=A0A1G8LNI9_9GAMM|nr:MFS transporter [Ferrimonas sediminum]SDI57282.1 Major Facilitator Superfamily protein [Ferrimonas sediminum]